MAEIRFTYSSIDEKVCVVIERDGRSVCHRLSSLLVPHLSVDVSDN